MFFFKSNILYNELYLFVLGVETSLIGYFEMVFGLLRAYHLPDVQERTLQVIWVSSRNRECISDIACTIRLPLLLVLFVKLPRATEILLKTLLALVSNGAVVKELLEYGGLIYVLSVFVNSDLDGTGRNFRSFKENLEHITTMFCKHS